MYKSPVNLDQNHGLILLVDDNSDHLHALSRILESNGFKVKKTAHGKTAIEMARKQRPDLIFLDLNIPDINGYKVYQHLKLQEETVNIPIIFMGTIEQITEKVRNFDVLRIDCIVKPFQESEVLTQVHNKLMIVDNNREFKVHSPLLAQEIEEHKQLTNALVTVNQNLQPIVLFDTVTRLANRRKFDEYLNSQWQALDKKKLPLSLLLCNFDFSSHDNNAIKDEHLQQIAREIKTVVKRSTDLVARYTNQQFAVILCATDSKGAVYVGKLIRQKVEQFKQNNTQFPDSKNFSLHIGVATIVPSDKMTPKHLIDMVEKAIDKAKLSGTT